MNFGNVSYEAHVFSKFSIVHEIMWPLDRKKTRKLYQRSIPPCSSLRDNCPLSKGRPVVARPAFASVRACARALPIGSPRLGREQGTTLALVEELSCCGPWQPPVFQAFAMRSPGMTGHLGHVPTSRSGGRRADSVPWAARTEATGLSRQSRAEA